MKVYLQPTTDSRGINRVVDALIKYKPDSVEIVNSPLQCDLKVLHVYGRKDHIEREINALQKRGKQYAMIQYVLRSSMSPDTRQWINLWSGAKVVWSYYNLAEAYVQDRGTMPDQLPFKFYYAPLGVDPEIFHETDQYRQYVITASGQHALSESVRECAFATKAVGGKMLHIGHELRRGEDIVCKHNISDREIKNFYSESEYVSGLRRVEGFELPVIEGLMCGARPIVFDRPEMRHWFREFAIFIQENSREQVIQTLTHIFKEKKFLPVTEEEKALVKKRFNWETIIKGFWKKIL